MARPIDEDADYAYDVIDRMGTLIRAGDSAGAERLSRNTLKKRQDDVYDRRAHPRRGARLEDDDEDRTQHQERDAERRGGFPWVAQREQYRARLFSLASPRLLLAPVNILERYLVESPMWDTWTWDATAGINARMLPYVQRLDPNDPLPDDARLALPFTAAAAFLRQALYVSPDQPPTDRTADVYHAIIDGIVTISRLEPPEGLTADFLHVADTAQLMLEHALRFALDAGAQHKHQVIGYGLVLRCPRGADCARGGPFYVNRSGIKDKHGACRLAQLRLVQGAVTTRPTKRKKSRRSRSV